MYNEASELKKIKYFSYILIGIFSLSLYSSASDSGKAIIWHPAGEDYLRFVTQNGLQSPAQRILETAHDINKINSIKIRKANFLEDYFKHESYHIWFYPDDDIKCREDICAKVGYEVDSTTTRVYDRNSISECFNNRALLNTFSFIMLSEYLKLKKEIKSGDFKVYLRWKYWWKMPKVPRVYIDEMTIPKDKLVIQRKNDDGSFGPIERL